MFDCDSDRRDFAKKQYKDFVKRNGGIVPEEEQKSTEAATPDLKTTSPAAPTTS